jgi:hypothetical protein
MIRHNRIRTNPRHLRDDLMAESEYELWVRITGIIEPYSLITEATVRQYYASNR